MDLRKLTRAIITAGLMGVAASAIWWMYFYSQVIKFAGTRDTLGDFFPCLFADTLPCTLVKNVASFAGYMPYEPMVMWLFGITLIVGAGMRYSVKD